MEVRSGRISSHKALGRRQPDVLFRRVGKMRVVRGLVVLLVLVLVVVLLVLLVVVMVPVMVGDPVVIRKRHCSYAPVSARF